MNISQQFLNSLNSSGTIKLTLVPNSDNFTNYLASHSASDGIIIPENFSADYLADNQVNVIVYGNPTSTTSSIVNGTVNEFETISI